MIPRLQQVRGVADVSNFGGLTTQFMLELDPAKLDSYGFSLAQVKDAINANNISGGGSVIDRGQQSYVVRGVGLLHSLDDMGNVVVSSKDGVPVLVKDWASSPTATWSGAASSARTTTPTPSKASPCC